MRKCTAPSPFCECPKCFHAKHSAPAVVSSALVRHCDRCLAFTAFDLDNTPANAKALKRQGQTVRIMDADEVKGMKLERCKCMPNTEVSQP